MAAREVIRAIFFVGGSQVINLLFTMIKMKFVAVLLGPVGVGLIGLFMNVTNLFASIGAVGMNSSGTRAIASIEEGTSDRQDNPLRNAPHPAERVAADDWSHPYTREEAAYPRPWVREGKYWPPVGRIDNVQGNRNPICACPTVEELAETTSP